MDGKLVMLLVFSRDEKGAWIIFICSISVIVKMCIVLNHVSVNK